MKKKVILSEKAHAWLELLLKDETIRNAMMMDQEVAKRITILDDGSVRLDKHKSKILNWLFNNLLNLNEISDIIKDHKVISEEDEYSEESFDDDFDDMNFGGEPSYSTTPSDSVPNSPNDFDNNEPPNQEPTDKPEMKPER